MTARSHIAALSADVAGNVLPIAAAGVLVGAAIVGGGVDMSRGYRAQNRLQAACDSAVLAGRRAVGTNGFDTAAEQKANDYFDTNFDPESYEAHDVDFEAGSEDNGNVVFGVATATVDTALMNIFGFEEFDFEVNCSASMGVGNSDVMMVLDNTGSMDRDISGNSTWNESSKRIYALKQAMKNFYDTLQGATAGSNARIRYGFVPYSASVNVGRLLFDRDPNFLRDTWTIQSREPVYVTYSTPSQSGGISYGSWGSWSYGSCPSTGSWENTGSPSYSSDGSTMTQQQRRSVYECTTYFGYPIVRSRYEYRNMVSNASYNNTGTGTFLRWDYKPIQYNVGTYKTFSSVSTLTDNNYSGEPRWQSSTWAGCIEERKTVAASSFSFSTLLGISPSGAFDLDLDMAPDYGDDLTKWAPMWPEVAYRRFPSSSSSSDTTSVTNYGQRAGSSCPARARLLSEMSESSFDAYADSLNAVGQTYLDLGMIWGGRLLSPDGIFQTNVNEDPANGGEVSRHIIFMTDGFMEPNNKVQSAYGIEYYDRRVTDNGSSNHASRHTSRFLAICRAIRAKGIRVWVIAFTSGLSSDLTTCASDNSSFTANDADELDEAFQEIAKQVGELRIIQ